MGAAVAIDWQRERLEPEGLGHELLVEWAIFARDDSDGRQSWSVKPRVARGYHGDPPDRWYLVNRIISRLLFDEPAWKKIVKPYYLGGPTATSSGYSIAEISYMTGRSEEGVLAVLVHVCGLVEREYRDWSGR